MFFITMHAVTTCFGYMKVLTATLSSDKLFCPDDRSDAVSRVYKLYDSGVNRRNVYLGRGRWPMTLLFTDSDTM